MDSGGSGVGGRGGTGDGQSGVFGSGPLRPAFCCGCFFAMCVLSFAVLFAWVLRFSGAGLRPAASSSAVDGAGDGWWV